MWNGEQVIVIAFDPDERCRVDRGEAHDDVPFCAVWNLPLARTIWLAREAWAPGTDVRVPQFRRDCIRIAERLMCIPAENPDQLYMRLRFFGPSTFRPAEGQRFANLLFGYVGCGHWITGLGWEKRDET